MNDLASRAGRALQNRHLVGGFVLAVVLFTLTLDILGLVFPCPYCRIQRLALGILSLILLSKWHKVLACRYIAALAGLYGVVVGVMQNFNHVKKINKGEFDWAALWLGHPWILSGLAVISLVWLLFLLFGLNGIEPD